MKFKLRAHGRTEIRSDGAIVYVVAEGPFNWEGIDEFSKQIVALYQTLPPRTGFVNVTEMRRTIVAPIDAIERLGEHLQRTATSGLPLLGTAWVVAADTEGRELMLPRVYAMFAQAGLRFEVFASLSKAQEWARSLVPN